MVRQLTFVTHFSQAAGIALQFDDVNDLVTFSGYLPARLDDRDTGFEWLFGTIEEVFSEARSGTGSRVHAPDFTTQGDMIEPAKVARLLALAHHVQNAVDRGVVADCATAARQLGLTRARLTQLLALTLLAPEIQEALLELEAVNGVEPTYERRLRRVLRVANWGEQRTEFAAL